MIQFVCAYICGLLLNIGTFFCSWALWLQSSRYMMYSYNSRSCFFRSRGWGSHMPSGRVWRWIADTLVGLQLFYSWILVAGGVPRRISLSTSASSSFCSWALLSRGAHPLLVWGDPKVKWRGDISLIDGDLEVQRVNSEGKTAYWFAGFLLLCHCFVNESRV